MQLLRVRVEHESVWCKCRSDLALPIPKESTSLGGGIKIIEQIEVLLQWWSGSQDLGLEVGGGRRCLLYPNTKNDSCPPVGPGRLGYVGPVRTLSPKEKSPDPEGTGVRDPRAYGVPKISPQPPVGAGCLRPMCMGCHYGNGVC